ncbi:hypothetical protein EST92_07525 [Streptomyces sp. TM32]|nr:hypothetical protein EST92_07525 [Streptomyces sp. TM32]
MRWLTLYAHSRQVPASLAVVVTSAVAVCALARNGSPGPVDPRLPALVLALAATASGISTESSDGIETAPRPNSPPTARSACMTSIPVLLVPTTAQSPLLLTSHGEITALHPLHTSHRFPTSARPFRGIFRVRFH